MANPVTPETDTMTFSEAMDGFFKNPFRDTGRRGLFLVGGPSDPGTENRIDNNMQTDTSDPIGA